MAKKQQDAALKYSRVSPTANVIFSLIFILLALLCFLPALLVCIVSFSSEASVLHKGYSFFPDAWSIDSYAYLARQADYVGRAFLNSIGITVVGTCFGLILCSTMGYALSRPNYRLRGFFTWFVFIPMLFSGGLVPSYIMNVRYLHINDSIWIFLLPSLVSVYNVIILRTFILTTIPDTLFEAARIDGAGHFRVYVSIVLPLFKAGIATIVLFNVVSRWNDWFTGMLYIKKASLIPLQTMLKNIQDNIDFLKQNAEVAGTPDGIAFLNSLPDQNLRMACTIIVIVPILCAYPFFQRYFVQGLTMGSVKE